MCNVEADRGTVAEAHLQTLALRGDSGTVIR